MRTFKLIILLLGAVFFLALGLIPARQIFRQYQAASFPTTTGEVYSSKVVIGHTSKGGTSYHAQIFYEYQVDGRTYQGNIYRYVTMSLSGSTEAYAAVRAHPAGSETTVYYRANDPEDSLLSPGIIGSDFLIFFMLVPACAFILLLLERNLQPAWFQRRHSPAGGVRVISQGIRTRANLPRYSICSWSLAAFCATSVVAIPILEVITKSNRSVQPEALGAGLVLAAMAGVFCWRRARRQAGVDDLVIDEAAQQITLPTTFGRKRPLFLPIKSVEAVYVAAIPHRGKYSTYYYSGVMLAVNSAAEHSQQLTDWSSKTKAVAFAQWLNERLQLPGPVNISEDL